MYYILKKVTLIAEKCKRKSFSMEKVGKIVYSSDALLIMLGISPETFSTL